ncbi:type 1 glutamine amidotransferase [Desulfolithobacter sp.]
MALCFLVLQHVPWEPPGLLLLQGARQLGIKLQVVRMWEQTPPDPAHFDALILLGGPDDETREQHYPFLGLERRYLMAWLSLDRPCLGFGLGHHLIAQAAGATIAPNFLPGAGFVEGHLTHDGRNHPLFAGIDTPLPLFKYHSQSIQTPVPSDMLLLATSSQCVVEAFCIKGRAHIIGLQFDNHAAHPVDMEHRLQHRDPTRPALPSRKNRIVSLLDEAIRHQRTLADDFFRILKNFSGLVTSWYQTT